MTEAVTFELLREHLNRPMSWAVWRNIQQMLDMLAETNPQQLADWVPYVEGSMRRHPNRVRFIGPWGHWLDHLLDIGQTEPQYSKDLRFSLVRGVYLESWYCQADNRVIESLVETTSLERLVSLDLSGAYSEHGIDEAHWRMFADAPHLQTLESLVFHGQPCFESFVTLLVSEPVLPNLKCVDSDEFMDSPLIFDLLFSEYRQGLQSMRVPDLDIAMFGRVCQTGLRSLETDLSGGLDVPDVWRQCRQSALRSLSVCFWSQMANPPAEMEAPRHLEHLSVGFDDEWSSEQLVLWAHALCRMLGSATALKSLTLALPPDWAVMMPVFEQYDVWSGVESLSLSLEGFDGPTDRLLMPARWPALRHLEAPVMVLNHPLPAVTSLSLPLGDNDNLWSSLLAHDVFVGLASLFVRGLSSYQSGRQVSLASVFESMGESGLRRVDFDEGRMDVEEIRALVEHTPQLESVDLKPKGQATEIIKTIGEYATSASLRYAFPAPFSW